MSKKKKPPLRIITAVILLVIISAVLNYHKNIIQYFNIRTLLSEKLDGRLVPHRINHSDKLATLMNNGIVTFEVDLTFVRKDNLAELRVGHGMNDLQQITFSDLLSSVQHTQLKKIWVDLKNVNEKSIADVLRLLDMYDADFSIKNRILIESSVTEDIYQKISFSGYQTSYYLPTDKIQKLLDSAEIGMLNEEAGMIKNQIERQGVSAVSFDLSIYSFVKTYLEPVISEEIDYHTWGTFKMWHYGELDKIKDSDCFNDSRVKTILYQYW